MKDIINGLFLGCIQNKAILISMSVGRHDRVVLKYWIFFLKGKIGQTIMSSKKERCSIAHYWEDQVRTNIFYRLEKKLFYTSHMQICNLCKFGRLRTGCYVNVVLIRDPFEEESLLS